MRPSGPGPARATGRGAGALAALALIALLASAVAAQTPYATYAGSGFDRVNLGDLSVSFSIPIYSKAGRGLPFSFALSYTGYAYTNDTVGGWEPYPNLGWSNQQSPYVGSVTYSEQQSSCPDSFGPYGPTSWWYWTEYYGFVYHDARGGAHPFGAYVTSGQDSNPPSCAPPMSSTWSGASNDGGWSLTVNILWPGATPSWSLYDSAGLLVNAPLGGSPSVGVLEEDRNGNELSETSASQYIDTLGDTALAVTSASPGETDFSYTNPGGGTSAIKELFTAYAVQTSFGCAGMGEFSAEELLPTSVVYPDGTSYAISYEMNGSATTGRIAAITLPTGATIHYDWSGGGVDCQDGTALSLKRWVTNPAGTTIVGPFTYARAEGSSSTLYQTTATTPGENGTENTTVYQFTEAPANNTVSSFTPDLWYEYQRDVYQGGAAGQPLAETITCWTCSGYFDPDPAQGAPPQQTAPAGGVGQNSVLTTTGALTALTSTLFSGPGEPREVDEYGYCDASCATASPVRKTFTAYMVSG